MSATPQSDILMRYVGKLANVAGEDYFALRDSLRAGIEGLEEELIEARSALSNVITEREEAARHAAAAETMAVRLVGAMGEIEAEIDGRIDVEDRPDGEGTRPNIFMRIGELIDDALLGGPFSSEHVRRVREQTEYAGALRDALESANSLCRSAYQIAQRISVAHGNVVLETNFGAFARRLEESLALQHRVMFPNATGGNNNALENRMEAPEELASANPDVVTPLTVTDPKTWECHTCGLVQRCRGRCEKCGGADLWPTGIQPQMNSIVCRKCERPYEPERPFDLGVCCICFRDLAFERVHGADWRSKVHEIRSIE